MIEVQEGKTFKLEAPFIVTNTDGTITDTTIAGSQTWEISPPDLAILSPQADGTAQLTPVGAPRGEASVVYKARAISADGVEIDVIGRETYNIIDTVVIAPTPIEVPIISTDITQ